MSPDDKAELYRLMDIRDRAALQLEAYEKCGPRIDKDGNPLLTETEKDKQALRVEKAKAEAAITKLKEHG